MIHFFFREHRVDGIRGRSLVHCFLHERGDPCLFGRGQPCQREAGRPHVAFVEVRLVAETERRVPRLELAAAWKKQTTLSSLAYAGIRSGSRWPSFDL